MSLTWRWKKRKKSKEESFYLLAAWGQFPAFSTCARWGVILDKTKLKSTSSSAPRKPDKTTEVLVRESPEGWGLVQSEVRHVIFCQRISFTSLLGFSNLLFYSRDFRVVNLSPVVFVSCKAHCISLTYKMCSTHKVSSPWLHFFRFGDFFVSMISASATIPRLWMKLSTAKCLSMNIVLITLANKQTWTWKSSLELPSTEETVSRKLSPACVVDYPEK